MLKCILDWWVDGLCTILFCHIVTVLLLLLSTTLIAFLPILEEGSFSVVLSDVSLFLLLYVNQSSEDR